MTIRNIRFFLFGDYKEIEAQPQIILEVSTKLMENGIPVIPGTFQQINPNLGLKSFERIMFNNSKEKITIQIGLDAIEITKIINEKKLYNFKTHTDHFLSQVKKIIKSFKASIKEFSDGRRVSLVIDIIHDDEKIKSFNEIYTSFNNTLPNYDPDETFEWNTRAVKRKKINFLGNEEEVNVVTEVQRIISQVNDFGDIHVSDTIQTKIDINTIDSNNKPRINEEFINEFLNVANEIFSSHNADVEVKIIESN